MVVRFNQLSKHTMKRGTTHHTQMLARLCSHVPPSFHNAQSLEMWIQHDSHHVVSMLCIKRPQKLQKRFDYFYHLHLHILVQKEDLSFKKVKDFNPSKSCNNTTSMSIVKVMVFVNAFDNNQWPLD